VFEVRVLRRIIGLTDNVAGTGGDLLCLPYIWMVKAVSLRWVGYGECMEVSRGAYKVLVGET
jgi:hypothetical protein